MSKEEAIELARMQDDQLSRSRRNLRPEVTEPQGGNSLAHPIARSNASLPPVKKNVMGGNVEVV